MRTAALVCFDENLETEGVIGVLREFDPSLDVCVIHDPDRFGSVISTPEDLAWLLVDVEGLGQAVDEVIAAMRERARAARIIAFGASVSSHDVDHIMRLGVSAFVPHRFGRDALLAVFALARAGERFRPVPEEPPAASPEEGPSASFDDAQTLRQFGLTKAEHDVLMRVAQGKTNLQIALELGKEEGTVRVQMSAILRKLKVRNRGEAIVVAMREQSVIEAQMEHVQSNPMDLGWLYPHMEFRRCRSGEVLFRAGDRGTEMYIVQRGRVSLPQLGVEMQENDMFGEIAIFAPSHRRTSSAVCVTDTDLFVLGEDKVKQIHYLNPSFALTVLQLITNRLLADRQRAD